MPKALQAWGEHHCGLRYDVQRWVTQRKLFFVFLTRFCDILSRFRSLFIHQVTSHYLWGSGAPAGFVEREYFPNRKRDSEHCALRKPERPGAGHALCHSVPVDWNAGEALGDRTIRYGTHEAGLVL